MLTHLEIREFALVESVRLEFDPGFNVLTGETGAGKSILVDAISAALGARVGPEVVREGADRAAVEAVFTLDPGCLPGAEAWAEDGQIILSREIAASGRSTFRINGRICTASVVKEVAAGLLDVHGQHEHQSLLDPGRHAGFLDAWADPDVLQARDAARECARCVADLRGRLAALNRDERERAQRLDTLRFQTAEIAAAQPDPDEEARLRADRRRLANTARLAELAGSARELLSTADRSALELLAAAAREVGQAAELDPDCAPIGELLETAFTSADEAAAALRAYQDRLEADPHQLEVVEERLETYRRLRRKYGDTVEEILALHGRLREELERLEHHEEDREALCTQLAEAAERNLGAALKLHRLRQDAARRFEAVIMEHLADLGMAAVRFAVESPAPEASQGGDVTEGRLEFLISANPGEPLRPLARVASGGELSRIMLALKSAMAGSHPVALIFDEIDTGVGGRTAESLGRKMAALARSNQVLCVTHLPQIAALADRHFLVAKESVRPRDGGERTRIVAEALGDEERVRELARMLGGAESTAIPHARKLIDARERPTQPV